MRNKFQPKPVRPATMVDMPCKQDRLALYRRIERVTKSRCAEYGRLLDTRKQSFFSSATARAKPMEGIRKRQIEYLTRELLPTVSAALLLELEDLDTTVVVPEPEEGIGSTTEQDAPAKGSTLKQPIECIALLICNMVLVCKGNYDARVRSILKTVCVEVLLESPIENANNPEEFKSRALYFLVDDTDDEQEENGQEFLQTVQSYIPELSTTQQATLQFESIERAIATDILKVLVERDAKEKQAESEETNNKKLKKSIIRGLQITTVGVVVGSIFAVTGGLAAPGLVAAITALGIHGTGVAFATLTTTTALASMFGAVGGGLGAYKMSKRVKGLSEWKIRKETRNNEKDDSVTLRGLHAHVCVSGWLSDKSDFQRPFGVQANDPKMPQLESLRRFFCYHDPEKVRQAEDLLKANKGEEEEFWYALAGRYGKDPDHVLPLDRSKDPSILPKETEAAIYGLLNEHVLDDESAERMKSIFEANTMLVQMEAKNMEVLAEQMDTSLEVEEATPSVAPSNGSVRTSTSSTDSDEEELLIDAPDNKDSSSTAGEDSHPAELDSNFGNSSTKKEDLNDSNSLTQAEFMEGSENAHPVEMDSHFGNSSINADQTESGKTMTKAQHTESGKSMTNTVEKEELPDSPYDDSKSLAQEYTEGNENEKDSAVVGDASNSIMGGNAISSETDTATNTHETDGVSEDSGQPEQTEENEESSDDSEDKIDHSQVVWDWEATYAGEMYTVTWETDFLLKLCRVANVLFQEFSTQASKQILTTTLVGSAVAVPSALMVCAEVIDDPYQIIASRSELSGIELAHCLLQSEEHRPISLVGYSFGARVIFSCLLELAKHQAIWQERQNATDEESNAHKPKKGRRKNKVDDIDYVREPASIVEDVILIGMPRLIETKEWVSCRELVGGRIVNCFNRKDWIVSYMINIRCWNGIRKTCGAYPIENIEGVENFEVSAFASTHGRYQLAVPQILHKVGYSQPRTND